LEAEIIGGGLNQPSPPMERLDQISP
jgi:hypothetical protein